MRTAALAALGLMCAMAGQYAAYRLNARVRTLEKIQVMLCTVENEIRYLLRPAAEIIARLAENPEFSSLKFVADCRARMDGGENFHKAWREALGEAENVRLLKSADVAALISFGELFGATDCDGQVNNCRVHSELIGEKLREARLQRDRYASLSLGMGFTAGIGIFIVLI